MDIVMFVAVYSLAVKEINPNIWYLTCLTGHT